MKLTEQFNMKNLSNLYNYYTDSDGVQFMMISKKINFPKDNKQVYSYVYVSENTPWTILSYKLYGTIDYWWVLCSLNDYMPFYAKRQYYVKYIQKDLLEQMLGRVR